MTNRADIIRKVILGACFACLLMGVDRHAHGQEVLTNQDVIEMTRAKVDPAVIISTIESSRSRFAVAVPDIVALSNAKVARDVIRAMQAAVARSGQPTPGMGASEESTPRPTEFGMYVVQDGQPSRLPEGATSTQHWRDPRNGPFRVFHIADYQTLERKEVMEEQPTFILFHPQAGEGLRVQMFAISSGAIDESRLRQIPLRIGAAGPDPRMVTITPELPLPQGSYAFVTGANFTRAYGFGRVVGQRDIPTLSPEAAMSLVRRSAAFTSTISPDAAKAIILAVISRERIVVERDFDDDGLLITTRAFRGGGLLGTQMAVQYVVLVRPAATGSEILVAADAYVAGSASGLMDARSVDDTPLVASRQESRWRAEGLARDFRREIQRAR